MINVAVKAARAAGSLINRAALDIESVRVSSKQVNDFVTEVDVSRDGEVHHMEFERGKTINKLDVIGKAKIDKQ